VPLYSFSDFTFLQLLKWTDFSKKCWIVCCWRVHSTSWLNHINWRGYRWADVNFSLCRYIAMSVELKVVHSGIFPTHRLWLCSGAVSLTAELMCITNSVFLLQKVSIIRLAVTSFRSYLPVRQISSIPFCLKTCSFFRFRQYIFLKNEFKMDLLCRYTYFLPFKLAVQNNVSLEPKLTVQRLRLKCIISRFNSYRAVNTIRLGYKEQSVNAV
jgi:hypothetical protein